MIILQSSRVIVELENIGISSLSQTGRRLFGNHSGLSTIKMETKTIHFDGPGQAHCTYVIILWTDVYPRNPGPIIEVTWIWVLPAGDADRFISFYLTNARFG